jgi:hypothetical protein
MSLNLLPCTAQFTQAVGDLLYRIILYEANTSHHCFICPSIRLKTFRSATSTAAPVFRDHSWVESPYARAREGVTRKQHLLNRDGSIPSANVGGAHGAVSSDMRLFCSGPW